ncbi:putative F-box protein [Zea mays]|uniref:Putative F-box protein n=1 Tax=Zea mays TaxID=4577 RepID=A0A3L6FQK5_MAIZE|nr:putative F-box protein [Zea mays]
MGKAFSLLRPPQPPREDDTEMMELRKRPRPRRLDPDFLSSPPPMPPRKRARKQAAAPKPVEAAGALKWQPPRKGSRRASVGIGCPVAGLHPATCGRQPPLRMSTRVLFRPRHPFNWYEPDLWTEVAKHLCGFDLLRLSLTCRWFHRLLADDSIWRYAFFRDLNLTDANPHVHRPLSRSWRYLYFAAFVTRVLPSLLLTDGSHAFSLCQNGEHRSSWRIGSFVLDSPHMVLIGKLPLPKWLPSCPEDVRLTIAILGACKLLNVRPGIWITDMHVMRCPLCKRNSCRGNKQILDARHSELFLEKAYWDETLEYESLGEHFQDEEVAAAFCAVVNAKQFASPSTASVLNRAWTGKHDDPMTRHCASATAAAIHTNLQSNGGLLSTFEAMRDTARDGQIVSIRISQVLF